MVKLNSDGSAITNPRKIGGGEVIRDHKGDIIYTYAAALGQGTNNQAGSCYMGAILVFK